jgi:hypothetical protein
MNSPGYTPPQPPPVIDPPPHQALAFVGGCFFAVALVMAAGTALLWKYLTSEGEKLRGDPGFAGFGLAIFGLGAFVVLIVVASIIGTAAGAATVVRYKRVHRFPVHSVIGSVFLVITLLYCAWGYVRWKTFNPALPVPGGAAWTPPSTGTGPQAVSSRTTNSPPASSTIPSSPGGNSQNVSAPNTPLARGPVPTQEEIMEHQRVAQQEAPTLLGEWMYPNSRVIPFTPRPGDNIPYRVVGLQTTDDLQTVLQFYSGKTTVGGEAGGIYKFEGKRPGDERDCSITVRVNNNTVFIRFDTR